MQIFLFMLASFSLAADPLIKEWFYFPEHIVIELDPVKTLLKYGVNRKIPNPLHHALEAEDYEAAALLVDYTEHINTKPLHETPLFRFMNHEKKDAPLTTPELKFLAKLAHRLDEEGIVNALNLLIRHNQLDAAAYLIKKGADPNKALHTAILSKDIPRVAFLLERGALPEGHLNNAVATTSLPLVKLLIAYGADINENHSAPLFTAISFKDLSIAGYLLEIGADPNRRPILKSAVEKNHEEAVQLLLNYGARY